MLDPDVDSGLLLEPCMGGELGAPSECCSRCQEQLVIQVCFKMAAEPLSPVRHVMHPFFSLFFFHILLSYSLETLTKHAW